MIWQPYFVDETKYKNLMERGVPIEVPSDAFKCNCGVELYSDSGNMSIAVYDDNLKAIRKLRKHNPIFNSIPNRDLILYNDYLLDENITTVIVDGIFGTGKTSTLCSHLVSGLYNFLSGKEGIPKAYISKPHETLGKGYGYLPGDLEDKTLYEFSSYYQYFNRFGQPGLVDKLRNPEFDMLEILVFEYLRGRDIEEGWVILDEAQNTDYKEMISFVSRIGDDAKLIIIGDTSAYQIDKKSNSNEVNGLSFIKNLYVGKSYVGYVELKTPKHILRGQRVRDLYLTMKEE